MPRRALLIAIALVAALSQSACIAFPFSTPPIKASAGSAMRWSASPSERPSSAAFNLDAGIHPLQLPRELRRRAADIGLGYTLDVDEDRALHGAYLEGGVFPIQGDLGRLGIHGLHRVFFDSQGVAGVGVGLRLSAEMLSFVKGPFAAYGSDGGAVGLGMGEGGVGLYLEGSYSRIENVAMLGIGGGLVVRLPWSFGVAWMLLR